MDETAPLPPINPTTAKRKKLLTTQVFSSLAVFDILTSSGSPATQLLKEMKPGTLQRTERSEAAKVLLAESYLNENEAKLVKPFFTSYMNSSAVDFLQSGLLDQQPQYLKDLLGLIIGYGELCPTC